MDASLQLQSNYIFADINIVFYQIYSHSSHQEIFMPAAGYISAITSMHSNNHSETSFAFGASDGNIQIYERSNEWFNSGIIQIPEHDHQPLKCGGVAGLGSYPSMTETLVSITSQLEKQLLCYSIEPWDLKWCKKVQGTIGNAIIDHNFLLMSNLKDRVDKYAIPTLQHLTHGNWGNQIIPVTSHEGCAGCTIVTGSCFNRYSSMKVWKEGKLISMEEDAMPALPLVAASSTLQLAQFTIIWTLMELCLWLHDTVVSVLWVM
ncbi:hypothetical protein BDR04DRAFT_1122482 [Suillus decipiens]|nr:hypothetical protein BDR04DRAFT_1122482 [Suillus decipiens]